MEDLKTILFDATDGKSPIYERLLTSGRYEEGRLWRKRYGDGEIGHAIQPRKAVVPGKKPSTRETLTRRKVMIVGDFSTPDLIMDTYDVCHNAFDETALEITLVVPESSLPTYASRRQAVVELFNSVPKTRAGNKLILALDHFDGTWHYTTVTPETFELETAYDKLGHDAKPILLYTSSYEYLAREMMQYSPDQFELGKCINIENKDGIPFAGLDTDVLGRRVIIVSGTISAKETLEQFYLVRAVARAGALWCDIIESYFCYGTMERKTKSGEAVKAKSRARMLSSLPQCTLGNRVIFVDLHADGVPYYLEGSIQRGHAYIAKYLVAAIGREMLGLESTYWLGTVDLRLPKLKGLLKLVLGSLDFGRFKWIMSMGDDTGLETAYGVKERVGDDETVFTGAMGRVLRRHLLAYDDKVGTGGTSVKACQGFRLDQYGKRLLNLVKKLGIENVEIPEVETWFSCTHFVGGADVLRKLFAAKDVLGRDLFTRIIAANSHPCVQELARDPEFKGRFQSKSIAPLLCKAVRD